MREWDGLSEPIDEIKALKRQQSSDDAQSMLEKVYRYVLPIMRRRKYRVRLLAEFLPRDANLLGLNVNHGLRINLRLRYAHDPTQMLPFEHVLGTMLHELCHNTFGPHDAKFFKLLDELTAEMEDMMATGFTGDKFTGTGRRLNVKPQKHAPRQNVRGLTSGPGYRLGGPQSSVGSGPKTLRERAFEAAERRRLADRRCGNGQPLNFEDLGFEEISKEEFESMIKKSAAKPLPKARADAWKDAETLPRPSKKIKQEIVDLTGDSE